MTGAASGIGRALAIELAARGCDLALADRDEAGLQAVAAEIAKARQRKVTTHRVDVGEPGQIAGIRAAATAAHPGLNIVINNAGVALLGQFNEIDQAQMEWLININFWGVVHGDPRVPAASVAGSRRRISSTSPRSSASSPRPARRPIARQNSRCAAFPKACGMSLRWRTAP